jgi:hypothetical protein
MKLLEENSKMCLNPNISLGKKFLDKISEAQATKAKNRKNWTTSS